MNRAQQLQQYLPNIIALYGYGSGFINQKGYTDEEKKKAMDDYIAIVEDTKEFHLQNYELNSAFYTPNSANYFQNSRNNQQLGTGLCFLSNLKYPFLDKKFKIGVISKKDFLEELNTWKSLALVGRFSKVIIPFKSDAEIEQAIKQNQKNVLIVSLLLLKKENKNNICDLISKICELSYIGDVRNLGFENPEKIKNIVYGNWSSFLKIYQKENPYFIYNNQTGDITINYDNLLKELPNLPSCLKEAINKNNCTNLSELQKTIYRYIKSCNQKNTVLLAYKGLRIIGFSSSFQYVSLKLIKCHKAKFAKFMLSNEQNKIKKMTR